MADLTRWRTSICKISLHTKEKLSYLEKRNGNLLEKMRQKDLQKLRQETDRRLMLDAMQIEATRQWPTLLNLDVKIDADVVIPQTILNFGEYQTKLQRLAMYAEQGDHKAMQGVLDNATAIEKKNQLLQPLFREIKSQIRHMTHTPELEVMRNYIASRRDLTEKVKLLPIEK